MDLQEYYIKKIDEFGGLIRFMEQLEASRIYFKPEEQFHVDEVKVYMSMVYMMKIDVAGDVIKYKDKIHKCTLIYKAAYEDTGSLFCYLMMAIHNVALNQCDSVRNIV